jgi:hypothetical protein
MGIRYFVYDGPTFIASIHATSREEAVAMAFAKVDGHDPANVRVITIETGSRPAARITSGSVTIRRGS